MYKPQFTHDEEFACTECGEPTERQCSKCDEGLCPECADLHHDKNHQLVTGTGRMVRLNSQGRAISPVLPMSPVVRWEAA